MKAMKNIICIALVLSIVLCFTACGGVDISGKYNLVSMQSGDETVNVSDLAELMGEDVEMYLELKADGTGVLNMMGETANMRYADGKIWEDGDEDSKVAFTVEDGTLTMTEDGATLVFEKE